MAKLIVNNVVSKTSNKGVAAALYGDSSGNYLRAYAFVFSSITDPSILETLVGREELALANDLIQTRCLVASDCKPVVDDILEGTMRRWGALVSKIKARASVFQECKFVFEW
jgi:hypothetical protein